MNINWSYYVNDIRVYPVNQRELQAESSLDSVDYIYSFRNKLNSEIKLVNNDYTLIKGLEQTAFESIHTFVVKCNSVIKYEGIFTIRDVSFNPARKTCSLKTKISDVYNYIKLHENDEVNIIEGITSNTAKTSQWSKLGFYVLNVQSSFNNDPIIPSKANYRWIHTKKFYSAEGTDYYHIVYATEEIYKDDQFSIIGWAKIDDSFSNGQSLFRRSPSFSHYNNPSTIQVYLKDTDYPSGYLIPTGFTYVPCVYDGGDGSISNPSKFLAFRNDYELSSNNEILNTYKSYGLKQSLQYILDTKFPEFTGKIKSHHLFNDALPPGKIAVDFISNITRQLITKSDFINSAATSSASIGNITLKKLLSDICTIYKCASEIDENGDLRIEHVTYFEIQQTEMQHIEHLNLTLEYDYIQYNVPYKTKYTQTDAFIDEFLEREITYPEISLIMNDNDQETTVSISTLSTDIVGMMLNTPAIDIKGWILVETGQGFISQGRDPITNKMLINGQLTIASIINNYYRHLQFSSKFYINGVEITSLSLKRKRKQNLVFLNNIEINPLLMINTKLGNAKIVSLKQKNIEGFNYEMEVHYE